MSAKWIRTLDPELADFSWQQGYGVPVESSRRQLGLLDERVRSDPVLTVQERTRQRLLGRHCAYSLAVSFARRGREGQGLPRRGWIPPALVARAVRGSP